MNSIPDSKKSTKGKGKDCNSLMEHILNMQKVPSLIPSISIQDSLVEGDVEDLRQRPLKSRCWSKETIQT